MILQNKKLSAVAGVMWRIVLSGIVFAIGLIISRLILYALDVALPRMPQQANESVAAWYLFGGSLILSAGLFALIRGISGAYMIRLLILFLFFYAGFGISTTIESAIYSDVEGYTRMIPVLLLPVVLFSLLSIWLTKPQTISRTFSEKTTNFFKARSMMQWLKRFLPAVISFPVIYFVFGIAVSPVVTDYYSESSYGLDLLGGGTKNHLIVGLGLAHFVMVFSYDIVLAYQLPMVLVLIHGVEILLDSVIYSWVIVKLLYTKQAIG